MKRVKSITAILLNASELRTIHVCPCQAFFHLGWWPAPWTPFIMGSFLGFPLLIIITSYFYRKSKTILPGRLTQAFGPTSSEATQISVSSRSTQGGLGQLGLRVRPFLKKKKKRKMIPGFSISFYNLKRNQLITRRHPFPRMGAQKLSLYYNQTSP